MYIHMYRWVCHIDTLSPRSVLSVSIYIYIYIYICVCIFVMI